MGTCKECCNWTEDESTKEMGKCVVTRGWKCQDGPQCKEFNIPYTFVPEQTLGSLYKCSDCDYWSEGHNGLGKCSEMKGLKNKDAPSCGNFCPESTGDAVDCDDGFEDACLNRSGEHECWECDNWTRREGQNAQKGLNTGDCLEIGTVNAYSLSCDKFRDDRFLTESVPKIQETVTKVQESVTDLTEIVTNVPVSTFDYGQVDEDTAEFLQIKSDKINQIKMSSMLSIAKELKEVHDRLANNKSGTFGFWCSSIGISIDTAQNYIRAFNYIAEHFGDISDAELIPPTLLFAISKPSAPEELQQAVISGDIKTHKEYKTLLAEFNRVSEERNRIYDDKCKAESITRTTNELYRENQAFVTTMQEKLRAECATVESKDTYIGELANQLQELKSRPIDVAVQEVIPPEVQAKADLVDTLTIEIAELKQQLEQKPTYCDCLEIEGTLIAAGNLLRQDNGENEITDAYGDILFTFCPVCGRKIEDVERGVYGD